jgi:hypothetical protein
LSAKQLFAVLLNFELQSLRNTRKHDKPKRKRGKCGFLWIFLGKVFDMGLFAKIYLMVFLNSPYRETRNAQKRTKKKGQGEKKSAGGWVWDLANARGCPSTVEFVEFVFTFYRPLALNSPCSEPRGCQNKRRRSPPIPLVSELETRKGPRKKSQIPDRWMARELPSVRKKNVFVICDLRTRTLRQICDV